MKAITVKELMDTLKTVNPNALVALSSDGEGNSFSLMCDDSSVSEKVYLKNELGYQDTYYEESEMKKQGATIKRSYIKESVKKSDLYECVILWPCD